VDQLAAPPPLQKAPRQIQKNTIPIAVAVAVAVFFVFVVVVGLLTLVLYIRNAAELMTAKTAR
jgi:hypothetical protein